MNKTNENRSFATRDLVSIAALIALSVVLYAIDKAITVPLNAFFATGGATTLIYFLPIMVISSFYGRRAFLMSTVVVGVAMLVFGTSAMNFADFILEYMIPVLSIIAFTFIFPYGSNKKVMMRLISIYVSLVVVLVVTVIMYTVAGNIFYGVEWMYSLTYNLSIMILPIIVLTLLLGVIFESVLRFLNSTTKEH